MLHAITCASQVGRWAGGELRKVGEGLCASRAEFPIAEVASVVVGGGELYVGGAFTTRVRH